MANSGNRVGNNSILASALDSDVEHQDQRHLLDASPTTSLFPKSSLDGSTKTQLQSVETDSVRNIMDIKNKSHNGLKRYSRIALFATGCYTTLLSGAWLIIAAVKPQWGSLVNLNGGSLTPAMASTLVNALAKTIELSFTTFYLATIGQYFTRKAISSDTDGISLSDLQLKMLMISPGTLLTQWKTYSQGLRTFSGICSVVACLSTMLYTTASSALGKIPVFVRYRQQWI